MHSSCAGPVRSHGLKPQSNLISIHSGVESEKYLGGLHLGLDIKHTQVNSARKTSCAKSLIGRARVNLDTM